MFCTCCLSWTSLRSIRLLLSSSSNANRFVTDQNKQATSAAFQWRYYRLNPGTLTSDLCLAARRVKEGVSSENRHYVTLPYLAPCSVSRSEILTAAVLGLVFHHVCLVLKPLQSLSADQICKPVQCCGQRQRTLSAGRMRFSHASSFLTYTEEKTTQIG